MTLLRTIVVLVAGLLVLLAVVVLRTESARLHYRIAATERETRAVHARIRAGEVELARLQNPMILRRRAAGIDRTLTEREDDAEGQTADSRGG